MRSADKDIQRLHLSDATALAEGMKTKLAMKLQQLNQEHRLAQKNYLDKLRSLGLGEEPAPAADSQFLEILEEDEDWQLARERDDDINALLQNLQQLTEVFNDLSALVLNQGTILDRIDYNVEQTKTQVSAGLQQLVKAEKHQRSARAGICLLVLVVLIVVVTLVLIFRTG